MASVHSLIGRLRKSIAGKLPPHSSPWLQQDSGMTLSTGVSMVGVLEITLIVLTLQRGNASQDAPRPLWM